MKINLHIERIVLDGLPVASHERAIVQLALENELARLLAIGGLSPELAPGGPVPYVAADPIQFTSGAVPAHMGRQIAGAVHSGIGVQRMEAQAASGTTGVQPHLHNK